MPAPAGDLVGSRANDASTGHVGPPTSISIAMNDESYAGDDDQAKGGARHSAGDRTAFLHAIVYALLPRRRSSRLTMIGR